MGGQGKQNIHLCDWHRLLIGQAPWTFMVEVLIRAAITYILLLIFIRLLGKRVASQLSLPELAIIVTLGAAVGVPLEVATQGILPAVAVLLVAVMFQRGLSYWSFKNRAVEILIQGDLSILCIDGRLAINAMSRNGLSRERLFAVLRASGIQHLGQLRRVYMESNGEFTFIHFSKPNPGLTLLPQEDRELMKKAIVPGHFACSVCGNVIRAEQSPNEPCEFCHNRRWTEAVNELE